MPRTTLTQSFIYSDECVCPEGRTSYEYNCSQVIGMYLSVTPRGCKTYRFAYKDAQNKRRHLKIGLANDISLKVARAEAQKMRARILSGDDPSEERKKRNAMPTFRDFFLEDYLRIARAKKRSWANDESMFRLRLEPTFGSMKLDKITRKQIELFHISVREEGLAPATADHHLKLLKRVLGMACTFGVLTVNPASQVSLFRIPNGRTRFLTDDELRRLIRVLQGYENRPMACLVMWLLSTGCRAGEAKAATWADIDYEKRMWTITADTSKSKRQHFVPLNSAAIDVLDELKTRGPTKGHLFKGRRGGYRHLTKNWARICEAASLEGVTLHTLRHSFASALVSAGESLYSVQCLLNHASSQTTQIYAHLDQRSLEKSTDRVAERIRAASQ